VRFAGTFEHVTTFAVGVSTRRPFRVLVLADNANHLTRLVLDIAPLGSARSLADLQSPTWRGSNAMPSR
jgi:hypothetical protein